MFFIMLLVLDFILIVLNDRAMSCFSIVFFCISFGNNLRSILFLLLCLFFYCVCLFLFVVILFKRDDGL